MENKVFQNYSPSVDRTITYSDYTQSQYLLLLKENNLAPLKNRSVARMPADEANALLQDELQRSRNPGLF